MKFSTNIKPISYLKAHAAEVLHDLNEGGEPIIITQNGEAKAMGWTPPPPTASKCQTGVVC